MRVPKAKDIMSVPDMFLTKEERKEKQRRLQEKKEAEKPPPSGVTPSMFQKASVRREQLIAQADTSFKKPIEWRDLPFPSFPHVEHAHPLPEVVSTCHVSVVHGRAASLTSEPYFTGARLSSLSKALSSLPLEEVTSSPPEEVRCSPLEEVTSSLPTEEVHSSSPPEEVHSSSPPKEEVTSSPPENSPTSTPFEDTLQAFLVPLPPTHYQ